MGSEMCIRDRPHQCRRLSKISCLRLLDLSAAFNTIDHNILLSRLSSWFGITDIVLDWFKSYLSSLPFRVKCESSFSSFHTCFCGIPLLCSWPLLFIMYTTPLGSLVSSFSLNHYMSVCRLLFHPSDVHSSIIYLHGAPQQISSWMTSNLLTLNSSKTEFLFI